MVETEITNILEDYIDNDEDYFKVVDYIENQDNKLYAKNNTNKILINEKKELQQRIDKAIEYIEDLDKNKFETIDDVIVLDNYLSDLEDILRGEENE